MSEATIEEEQTLTLIRLKPETRPQVGLAPDSSDDDATFFARQYSTAMDCVELVIPASDPRNRFNGKHMCRSEFDIIEDSAPEDVDPYPVGSRWQHPNVSGPVTIVGPGINSSSNYRRVRYDDGSPESDWTLGAFDYSERLEDVAAPEEPRPLQVGDRVRFLTSDGGSIGEAGDLAIVTEAPDTSGLTSVTLETGRDAGMSTMRYAFRFERVAEEQPTEPTEASVTLTESELEEKLRQAREEATREECARLQQEHARWLDSLVEDAHQYANDNSLCSEFDRFMEEHDLPSRTREYRVEVTVTLDVVARDDNTAREIAREMVYNELPGSMDDNVRSTSAWRV